MDDFVYVLIAAVFMIVIFGIFTVIFPPGQQVETISVANFTLGSVGFVSDVAARTDNFGTLKVGEIQKESLRSVPKIVASAGIAGGEVQEFSANVPSWLIEPMIRGRVTFSVLDTNRYGNLIVKWNGKEVFKERADKRQYTITLNKNDIKESNNVQILAEGPGFFFWASTTYDIRNLEVQLEYGPAKLVPFVLSQQELSTLSKGEIHFFAIPAGSSILLFSINGREIYRKQPYGNDFAEFDISRVPLNLGNNIISIDAKNGTYSLQNVQLKIFSLSNEVVKSRTFLLTDDQFRQLEQKTVKGVIEYDIADVFKPGSLTIKLNGKSLSVPSVIEGTNKLNFASTDAKKGENVIEFSGTGHFNVEEVRIGLEK